jgi:mycothiol synthase
VSTFTSRAFRNDTDFERISALLDACEATDRLGLRQSVPQLKNTFGSPGSDLQRDLCLWEKDDGLLVGYAWLDTPEGGHDAVGSLRFRVHPVARNGELESLIIAWATARLREISRARHVSARLTSAARDDDSERKTLLEWHDFVPARYYLYLRRSLDGLLPEPDFPLGFTLRHASGESDAKGWIALYNEAFADHWGHVDQTLETYHHQRSKENYDPRLDLIAVAPDGTFAALCWCLVNRSASGRVEGLIHQIGTRRSFRKRGLGRAMLVAGLHRLKAAGLPTAALFVDAENPTGAVRLYTSVGFEQTQAIITYTKDV